MPIYDYRCTGCGKRFSAFFRSFSDVSEPACSHCGQPGPVRLPPRVRQLRSEEDRLDRLADPAALGDVDEDDPASVARWAKRLGGEMGEDLGPDFEEAMESSTSGEQGSLGDDDEEL